MTVEYFNQYTYLIFGTTTASQTTADSTPTHIVVNPNGTNTRLHTQYSHRYAGTPSWLFAPKLEYRGDTWEALLRGSYSSSQFNFRDNSKGFFQRTDSYLTRIGFTLDRASEDSNAWTLKQTAGRSWSDPTSFNRDDDIGNNIRTSESDAQNQMYGLNLDLKKTLDLGKAQLKRCWLGGLYRTDSPGRPTKKLRTGNSSIAGPTNDLTQKAPEAVIPWTQNYQFKILGFDAGDLNAPGLARRQQLRRLRHLRPASRVLRRRTRSVQPGSAGWTTTSKLGRRDGHGRTMFEVQPRVGKVRGSTSAYATRRRRPTRRVADIRSSAELKAAGFDPQDADSRQPDLPVP
ncbi:hypothetical protein ACRAWD_29680 [Caulobacter segnis]